FIHVARGDLRGAWFLNPVGLLMFTFVASQIPLVLNLMRCGSANEDLIEATIVQVERIPVGCDQQLGAFNNEVLCKSVERIRPAWLNRWVHWNQWLLIGLMLALIMQWIVKLLMGGSWE
ncbi:MAG: hypothetical protein ABI557_04645, partial [Aureliella sp.]